MKRIATLIGIALCMTMAGCHAADESPTTAYRRIHEHAIQGQWGSVYDRLTDRSRSQLSMMVGAWRFFGDASDAGDSRQDFIVMLSGIDEVTHRTVIEMMAFEVVEERADGEEAVLIVEFSGRKGAYLMVKDNEVWRLDAFFDLWEGLAAQRGTTPDLEQRLFWLRTHLLLAREAFRRRLRETGTPPTVLSLGNPLSPDPVAKQIVVIDRPGADGTTVEPSRAGWAWNSADGVLHAAGYDERTARREAWDHKRPDQKERELRTLLSIGRIGVRGVEPTGQDVRRQQWGAFGRKNPLRNPLSPDDVSTRIVPIATAGADGMSVHPSTAGWVWNSADRMLYVAGFAE